MKRSIEIGVFEAKNRLSALIADVGQGAEVTITLRGKPVAKLIPPETADNRERARSAAERIRARSATMPGFDWNEWRQYRDEGRK